jgi:hypothetical protein
MSRSHISTIDAGRVSMMVNSIPSAVILCTRERGSVAGSIEMRGGERARRPVMLYGVFGGEIRRGDDEEEAYREGPYILEKGKKIKRLAGGVD